MRQTPEIIIVPLGIFILFNTIAFAFVCFVLLQLRRSQKTKELMHQIGSRDFRVLVAVYFITGVTWTYLDSLDSLLLLMPPCHGHNIFSSYSNT